MMHPRDVELANGTFLPQATTAETLQRKGKNLNKTSLNGMTMSGRRHQEITINR